MLEEGREKNDYNILAEAYYLKALSNIDTYLKGEEVIDDLNHSSTYFRYVKDSLNHYKTRITLADVYRMKEQYYTESLAMVDEALRYFEKYDHKNSQAQCYTIKSQIYGQKQDFDLAYNSMRKALSLNENVNDTLLLIKNGITLSNLLYEQGKVEDAIEVAQTYSERAKGIGDQSLIGLTYFYLGKFNYRLPNVDLAISYFEKSLQDIPRESPEYPLAMECLSECYADKGKHSLAYDFQTNAKDMIVQRLDNEKTEIENRLALEFQTREKQTAIEKLEAGKSQDENRIALQRRWLFTLGFGVLAVMTALFYLVQYYSQKIKMNEILADQRSKIDKQTIKELETSMKIKNLESMVLGQELERERVASDLHDSLGGMLSALKLQFDAFRMNASSYDSSSYFNRVHGLIDDACGEVRDIARNLKPSTLEKMGITSAITDLINGYNFNQLVDVSFHSDIDESQLKYETKLHLYRIVQELLNNAMKHSKASEIDVQITTAGPEIILKVEDDGIGFEEKSVQKGLGMDNITSRVNVLQGDLNIDSNPGRGSSIIIHVPIDAAHRAQDSL